MRSLSGRSSNFRSHTSMTHTYHLMLHACQRTLPLLKYAISVRILDCGVCDSPSLKLRLRTHTL